MSEVKIHLTEEQQKQIKNATGKDITELSLKDLEKVSAGGSDEPVSQISISFSQIQRDYNPQNS